MIYFYHMPPFNPSSAPQPTSIEPKNLTLETVKRMLGPEAERVANALLSVDTANTETDYLEFLEEALPMLIDKLEVTKPDSVYSLKTLLGKVKTEHFKRIQEGLELEGVDTSEWETASEQLEDLDTISDSIDIDGARTIYEKLGKEAENGSEESLERLYTHKNSLLSGIQTLKQHRNINNDTELQNNLRIKEEKISCLQKVIDGYQSHIKSITSAANDSSMEEQRQAA